MEQHVEEKTKKEKNQEEASIPPPQQATLWAVEELSGGIDSLEDRSPLVTFMVLLEVLHELQWLESSRNKQSMYTTIRVLRLLRPTPTFAERGSEVGTTSANL